jgi:hypothetical protein
VYPQSNSINKATKMLGILRRRKQLNILHYIGAVDASFEIESIRIAQIGNQVNKRRSILAIRAISALVSRVSLAMARF